VTNPAAKPVRVAIDGPAGAGKSTVAHGLAERLGFILVDTGALYRMVALAAVREGLALDQEAEIGEVARSLVAGRKIAIERDPLHAQQGGSAMRFYLDGEDVSAAIRAPEMSLAASRVSAIAEVRAALLQMQRQAGAEGSVVLEGRDIGTVVFPDAEVKFFLTASPEVRAGRRYSELCSRGVQARYDETLADVLRRDKADTERPIAPLRQADDAIVIDSSGKTAAEVIEEMCRVVEARSKGC
jgi:cytidylate kinase